jgi:hypothetical protein
MRPPGNGLASSGKFGTLTAKTAYGDTIRTI